jgi:transaldolase
MAAMWEGIEAIKDLEEEGIQWAKMLMFSLRQAIAYAESGVTLHSPFVGRILDLCQLNNPAVFADNSDSGVKPVRNIFGYDKKWGRKRKTLEASFRNIDEITVLARYDFFIMIGKCDDEAPQITRNIPSRNISCN